MRKYKRTVEIVQVALINLGLLAGITTWVYPQGMCIPDPLTTSVVSGKVVAHLEQGETPIPDASVELLVDQYNGGLIAKVTTEANGSFNFHDIKPGKYMLKVSCPNLSPFYVRVRVIRRRSPKIATPQQEIIITMGADATKPCNGSRAEIRVKKDR
jgi:hypothetical protein